MSPTFAKTAKLGQPPADTTFPQRTRKEWGTPTLLIGEVEND
jgi:hypothetical protein